MNRIDSATACGVGTPISPNNKANSNWLVPRPLIEIGNLHDQHDERNEDEVRPERRRRSQWRDSEAIGLDHAQWTCTAIEDSSTLVSSAMVPRGNGRTPRQARGE